MEKILKVVVALVLCGSPVLAQNNRPLADSELAAITSRGRMLENYDTASWHATDAVLALKPAEGAVSRYIANNTDAGWVVSSAKFTNTKHPFLFPTLAP